VRHAKWLGGALAGLFALAGASPASAQNPDVQKAQQLYSAVSKHFDRPYVEARVGTLREGGRMARVVITDSVTFHKDEARQRQAAREVATFVRQQLAEEPDLRVIVVGWKWSGGGGVSSVLTFDFDPQELEAAPSQVKPS
jgi:outer membrane protein OmpA-like peptidoglycan-associated protein